MEARVLAWIKKHHSQYEEMEISAILVYADGWKEYLELYCSRENCASITRSGKFPGLACFATSTLNLPLIYLLETDFEVEMIEDPSLTQGKILKIILKNTQINKPDFSGLI